MNRIAQFEELLRRGRDDATLRFSLANEYYKCGQPAAAASTSSPRTAALLPKHLRHDLSFLAVEQ